MPLKKNSTKSVDPSSLFMGLKTEIAQVKRTTFDCNTQQDVAEILQVVFDELKGVSLAAN